MTHRRRRHRVLSVLLASFFLACAQGCTEGQSLGDALLEGVSNAIVTLAEAGLLTFVL
jgi:hypothetical protein